MTVQHLLVDVICSTFLKEVGKHQAKKDNPCGMLMSFSLAPKVGEEGFRHLDVLIYAPMNYVGVYKRERWDVIPEEDLLDDDRGPKPGKGYTKGESSWERVAYHDSGWPEGIMKILINDRVCTWSRLAGGESRDWYTIVDIELFKLPE